MTNYEIDILKKALLQIELEELNHFKNLPDENIEFSEEFETKIQKLSKRRKSLIWQATKTVPRRIAVILIAALITFCMMMTISAIRVPVVNFVINVYEDFISIFVEKEEEVEVPDSIEDIYMPSYIFGDYSLVTSNKNNKYVETIWLDTNNNIMILNQDVLETDYKIYLDNNGVDYQSANFKNLNVHFSSKNDQYFFIWTNGYYKFELVCSTQIELSEVEKLIESLTPTITG